MSYCYKILFNVDEKIYGISADFATEVLAKLDEYLFEISDTQYDGKEGLYKYLKKNENLEYWLNEERPEDREEVAATAAIQRLVDDGFIEWR